MFAQLGSHLDAFTQHMLNRGDMLNKLLNQDQCVPILPEEQVGTLYESVRGFLYKMPVGKIKDFEAAYFKYMRPNTMSLLEAIKKKDLFLDEIDASLKDAFTKFMGSFGGS